ncbi:hypothetical protein [Bifidobacterium aesculapii]|uniref:hypothetical protein n=1 Tax=Bifidobacterium aesculapii TaxID=1329411 RepID=UPI0006E1B6B0|nr:hypothetical protein [Bifidobacterium aesculapii]
MNAEATRRTGVARWLRARWPRIAIAAFALAATLIEWAAIPPVYPLNALFSGISVVAIILTPALPRAASWTIIATVVARLFVLDLSGPNPLWAAYLALAIIGYDSAIPVSITALLTVILAECVPVAMNRFNALSATWIGMVNYIGMFTLAAVAGMSFRWRRQRDEMREHAMMLERRQWRTVTLRRNTRLASRIHDSASGGLSYIALTAQRRLRRLPEGDGDDGERRDWEFVNTQALAVLDEIHHVIDLLEEPGVDRSVGSGDVGFGDAAEPVTPPESAAAAAAVTIRRAAEDGRERLERLGLDGSFGVRGEPPADCAEASVREAAALLGEVAANIGRHLTPATGAYYCAVTMGDDAIEIMETNPLSAPQEARTPGVGVPAHGSGLAMHRRIIDGLGGELNTSAEDGDWVLYARIPTRPGNTASSAGPVPQRQSARRGGGSTP